jgi:hypothetical protein
MSEGYFWNFYMTHPLHHPRWLHIAKAASEAFPALFSDSTNTNKLSRTIFEPYQVFNQET